jgi:multimeric flavodoxin WrbA
MRGVRGRNWWREIEMTSVVAFNGSPRVEGNTALLIRHVLQELEKEGITTELVQVGGQHIHGCTACMKCFENRNRKCVFDDDIVNTCIEKMIGADGIILGSPVYFLDITPEMKALIDRSGFVSYANGHLFSRKVGNAVVSVRRVGATRTFDSLLHFFLANDMVVPGLPGIGVGRDIGDVERDVEGIEQMKRVGQNIAWLLQIMNYSKKIPGKPVLADSSMS